MSALLTPDIESQAALYPPGLYPPRKRWTRAECATLEATGLWDRERLELIEGELIVRMARKRPHTIVFVFVLGWLTRTFGTDFLNPESPIDVSPEDNPASEPEPDMAVLAKVADQYTTGNPGPSDIRLLIEISDTSLTFDLGPKARLYARAGIDDYWVFDVAGRRVIVPREPLGGVYQNIVMYGEDAVIAPLAAPDKTLIVASAFPAIQR